MKIKSLKIVERSICFLLALVLLTMNSLASANEMNDYLAHSEVLLALLKASKDNTLPGVSDNKVGDLIDKLSDVDLTLRSKKLTAADYVKVSKVCLNASQIDDTYALHGLKRANNVGEIEPSQEFLDERQRFFEANLKKYNKELLKLMPFMLTCLSVKAELFPSYWLSLPQSEKDKVNNVDVIIIRESTVNMYVGMIEFIRDVNFDRPIKKKISKVLADGAGNFASLLSLPRRKYVLKLMEEKGNKNLEDNEAFKRIKSAFQNTSCNEICGFKQVTSAIIDELLPRAELGDAQAQADLGKEYLQQKREVLAMIWLLYSARQGNADGQYLLGFSYCNSYMIDGDEKCAYWLKKSAEQGNASGQLGLGLLYTDLSLEKEFASFGIEAVRLLKLAAHKTNPESVSEDAAMGLAHIYEEGRPGVAQDDAEAILWYKKAAQYGKAKAAYKLAGLYEEGKVTKKDAKAALLYYRRAADLNDSKAQYRLGKMYADGGAGLKKNIKTAREWYLKAAKQGQTDALYELGLIYEQGLGVEKNVETAFMWYEKAANNNHRGAKMKVREKMK